MCIPQDKIRDSRNPQISAPLRMGSFPATSWNKNWTIFRSSRVPAIFRESDFYLNSLSCATLGATSSSPPPKNVEQNILGYVDRLKFCSLFLLIAQFNTTKDRHTTHPQHTTTTKMSRLCPTLGGFALSFHGHVSGAPNAWRRGSLRPHARCRDRVWPRHGRFPYWGGKMKTQQKIERE
jgi:hypothetical protein